MRMIDLDEVMQNGEECPRRSNGCPSVRRAERKS